MVEMDADEAKELVSRRTRRRTKVLEISLVAAHWMLVLLTDFGLLLVVRRKNKDRSMVLKGMNTRVRVSVFAFRDCGSLFTGDDGRSFVMVHQWRKLCIFGLVIEEIATRFGAGFWWLVVSVGDTIWVYWTTVTVR
ncbi:hypothetical protein V8G54_009239 [Vigna mungo]|uniref:Transmembrane protein n=1 Tax=Vigna mungo TaxID=3915 RepID=A0AAQ3NWC4_VIGMU